MKKIRLFLQKIRQKSAERGFTCDGCNRELFDYPLHRFCAECEEKLYRNDKFRCEKCGRQTVTEGVCLSCKKEKPQFTKGFSPFVYRGFASALVNRMKNGDRYLAYYFGEKASEYFLQENPQFLRNEPPVSEMNPLLLVPVPMTEADERTRGYNQATELALVIQTELKKKGIASELDTELLQKLKQTSPQKQRSFFERKENIQGAFHVHKQTKCKGRSILLIDDIMTTGATGSECAERLLGAGAKEVLFLTAVSLPERK